MLDLGANPDWFVAPLGRPVASFTNACTGSTCDFDGSRSSDHNGTIASYDFQPTIRVQTRDCPEGKDVPVDTLEAPFRNPIEYFVDRIRNNIPFDGPLDPKIARIGQQIVDSAVLSSRKGKTVELLD